MKAKVLVVEVVDPHTNIPWTVRLVRKGERYGADNCLTNEEDKDLVEFYDGRYKRQGFNLDFGQFVSRYYATTLQDNAAWSPRPGVSGLCLQGDVPAWSISAEPLRLALEALGVW